MSNIAPVQHEDLIRVPLVRRIREGIEAGTYPSDGEYDFAASRLFKVISADLADEIKRKTPGALAEADVEGFVDQDWDGLA